MKVSMWGHNLVDIARKRPGNWELDDEVWVIPDRAATEEESQTV